MDNSIVLRRYILINIYVEKWKPGEKIFSETQLSIKFKLSKQTVKKILHSFLDNNILVSRKRVGYFVNEKIYEYLPLSLRQKYKLKPLKFHFKEDNNFFLIKKEYISSNFEGKYYTMVETKMKKTQSLKSFKENYHRDKTFMWNLAYNGFVPFQFNSEFNFKKINNNNFIVEKRELLDENMIMIAKEKIYVPLEIWRDSKKIKILA